MIRMLASVTNVTESRMVLGAGIDIIDLKNPAQGALGALPIEVITDVVHDVNGRCLISATIGDVPMQPALVLKMAEAIAATGVDIVKIGFFGKDGHLDCIRAITALACHQKIVAVLFADEMPDLALLPELMTNNFHGVMLDTAHKNGRRLPEYLSTSELRNFIQRAKTLGLMVGLAGSLSKSDISPLASLDPDYLGFRGALCAESNRTNILSNIRLREIQEVLHSCNNRLAEPIYDTV